MTRNYKSKSGTANRPRGSTCWSRRICLIEDDLFPFGRIETTEGALRSVDYCTSFRGLMRHALGDWGDVSEQDRAVNDDALARGGRLISVYHDTSGTKFSVTTDADRKLTTVDLVDDE